MVLTEGIDPKSGQNDRKVVKLTKLACNPYGKVPLLIVLTNMDPNSRGLFKGFKTKEAW